MNGDDKTCRCGHARGAHEHYRPGMECGLCGCRRYRDSRESFGARARHWLSWAPVWIAAAFVVAVLYALDGIDDAVTAAARWRRRLRGWR